MAPKRRKKNRKTVHRKTTQGDDALSADRRRNGNHPQSRIVPATRKVSNREPSRARVGLSRSGRPAGARETASNPARYPARRNLSYNGSPGQRTASTPAAVSCTVTKKQ